MAISREDAEPFDYARGKLRRSGLCAAEAFSEGARLAYGEVSDEKFSLFFNLSRDPRGGVTVVVGFCCGPVAAIAPAHPALVSAGVFGRFCRDLKN